jgi:hypothetical protein
MEFIWITSGSTLPGERRPIESLSFSTGRDLLLRHASGMFLAQGLLATLLGTRASAFQASGSILAWGASVFLWEIGARSNLAVWIRWLLAPVALTVGALLLILSWRAF